MRRRQILTCAWTCFSRNGFHASSMDDVIAATGTSASGVYRYFSGKEELIDAATDEALELLRGFFIRLLGAQPTPSPTDTITTLVGELANRTTESDYDLSKIAMLAWSEALRRPEVATRTGAFYWDVHGHLAELTAWWRTAGHLPADANPDDVATMLVTLMPGLIVNQHLVDPVEADQLTSGLAALGAAVTTG